MILPYLLAEDAGSNYYWTEDSLVQWRVSHYSPRLHMSGRRVDAALHGERLSVQCWPICHWLHVITSVFGLYGSVCDIKQWQSIVSSLTPAKSRADDCMRDEKKSIKIGAWLEIQNILPPGRPLPFPTRKSLPGKDTSTWKRSDHIPNYNHNTNRVLNYRV